MPITPRSIGLPPRFTSFRSEVKQRETIEQLAISDSRFLMLEAPPGTGKSVTGISLALIHGARALYLTKNKSLQKQGVDNFSSIGLCDIVGHSNYPCASVSYDDTGELADLECANRGGSLVRSLGGGGQRGQKCFYRERVSECLSTSLASTNYAHWFQLFKSRDNDRLGKFDLLICDEAHKLRDLIVEAVSIKLFTSQVDRYIEMRMPAVTDDLSIWISWSNEALRRLNRNESYHLSSGDHSKRDKINVSKLIDSLNRLVNERDTAEWVVCPINRGVQLKPLNVAPYSERYLFRGISKVLLMSATIFREDADVFGIPSSDLSYFEVQSAFDPRLRPVIYYPTSPLVRMSNRVTPGEKRLWLNQIDKILEFERDGKGLIHSRSYDRSIELSSRLTHRRSVLYHGRGDGPATVTKFKQSTPPCTLISPTVEEGEDLPYDLCRYVIIPKLPFLDYRDPYIAAIRGRDKEYGNRETARSIIQMALRGSRAVDDFCRIWIVDGHWGHFQKQKYFYPWFKKAFRQIDRLSQVEK